MASPSHVTLDSGQVYRTAYLRRWGANPTRLVHRLEDKGVVRRLGHGLFYVPVKSRFGEVPPSDEALLDAFLDGTPYVVTGPGRWNALGLGTTSLHVHPLVYNTKRSGTCALGGRTFRFRRVAFPAQPTAEWFVIDLLRHSDAAAVDRTDVLRHLTAAVALGRFDRERLMDMASRFGRRTEVELVRRALDEAPV